MKRIMVMLVVFVLAMPLIADAQVTQGQWFHGGSSSLLVKAGQWSYKLGDADPEKGDKVLSFNFSPMAGYVVVDRLPVGIVMDAEITRYTSSDDADIKSTSTQVAVGPFFRYYFGDLNNFMPFVGGSFGIGTYRIKQTDQDTQKLGYMIFKVGGGFSFFFNDYVGMDMFLGYGRQVYTDKNAGETGDETYKSRIGFFDANLGIVVCIGR